MKKLLLGALLLVAASGCKSNPYCLNCKDSGNGVITPEDMTPVLVDGGQDGMTATGPDMIGSGGPCAPTNGGLEICDGIDNDCNGIIDDVSPSKLIGDPKNCGACGNECKFPHAFGQCVGGFDGGMPTCKENGCQPGYIDLDGDPSNGCEYVCTPTTPATEICDGKDNNCDGQVDEGFTTTWFDAAKQMPKYDKLLADCGQCGTVCSLGPGSVMACQGTGTNGRGQCAVVACFNGNDSNGVHQTYRHNGPLSTINTTGCEYHCPKPATTTGNDCNPNGACTFPVETCNGIDDDCDFVADDNLTDPGLNGACPDGAPGKLCQDATTCGKGVCARRHAQVQRRRPGLHGLGRPLARDLQHGDGVEPARPAARRRLQRQRRRSVHRHLAGRGPPDAALRHRSEPLRPMCRRYALRPAARSEHLPPGRG